MFPSFSVSLSLSSVQEFLPRVFDFDDTSSGLNLGDLDEESAELDYFLLFFNADLVKLIVNETNNYGEVLANSKDLSPKSHMQSWAKLSCDEFYVFYALCFLMPHEKNTISRNTGLRIH